MSFINFGDNIVVNIILLIVGFVMLIKGADFFVDGASKIAAKFHIPQIIIGLTICAMGTSAPEAAVSISSAFKEGSDGIAAGNILGSNIMNILLILGVSAVIATLPIKKNTFRIEIPFVMGITVIMMILGIIGGTFNLVDGLIFAALFVVYFVYLFWTAKHSDDEEEVVTLTEKDKLWKMILVTLIGMVLVVFGSNFTVDGATVIASALGMDSRLIGLTVVAFGTSLPELITSCTAAKKGVTDIAIGNIVGSNIFNILFVIGMVSMIHPVPFANGVYNFIPDCIMAIVTVIILWLLCIKDKKLAKLDGIIMLVCFVAYYTYTILAAYGVI